MESVRSQTIFTKCKDARRYQSDFRKHQHHCCSTLHSSISWSWLMLLHTLFSKMHKGLEWGNSEKYRNVKMKKKMMRGTLWSKCCITKHHHQVGRQILSLAKTQTVSNKDVWKTSEEIWCPMTNHHKLTFSDAYRKWILQDSDSETNKDVAGSYGYDVPNATLNRKATAILAREILSSHDALAIRRHMLHALEINMQNF